jgi:hypothetical protein
MTVETDVITSIAADLIRQAVIQVIMSLHVITSIAADLIRQAVIQVIMSLLII